MVAPLSNLLKQKDIYFAFNFEIDLVGFQEHLAAEKKKAEEEAKKVKADLGLPLIIRPAFTMGGSGGGIV